MFDFTGVCTGQLCVMRGSVGDLKQHGAKVLGVSTDSPASHEAFCAANAGNYPLLIDWNKTVRKSYGVLDDKLGDLMGVSKRSVFVLDKEGVVRYNGVTEDPKVPPDATRILEKVKKLAT